MIRDIIFKREYTQIRVAFTLWSKRDILEMNFDPVKVEYVEQTLKPPGHAFCRCVIA